MTNIADYRIVLTGTARIVDLIATINNFDSVQYFDYRNTTTWDTDLTDLNIARLTLDSETVLYCFETPPAKRFDRMWEILEYNLLGFIFVISSVRVEAFTEARRMLQVFELYASVPYIVAVTDQHLPDAWQINDLRIALRIPETISMIELDMNDMESIKTTLITLLDAMPPTLPPVQ